MSWCCHRRAAPLLHTPTPRAPDPPRNPEEERVENERFEDIIATEGLRKMMFKLHRLFFKRRCCGLLMNHLKNYKRLN